MGIDLGRFKSKSDKEWVDWLADDPVPPSMPAKMRENATREASRPVVRRVGQQTTNITPETIKLQPDNAKTVSIHLSVPKFKFSKDSLKLPQPVKNLYKLHQKWVIGGSGIVAVVIVVAVVTLIAGGNKDSDNPAVLSDQDQKAEFAYSLPKGSSETIDGPVRFDSTRKVVNYRDSIGGVEITISQQQLPSGFKDDTANKVKKLAEDFSATKAITTANPTAYLGQDVKGPQTVIFSKKDLLVFIQSTNKIDEHDWAEYITNLQ